MKPSKEIFNLVVEKIREEYKQRLLKSPEPSILETREAEVLRQNPNSTLIQLDITKHNDLNQIGSREVRRVVSWLELVEKVLKDCSPCQHLFSGKPLTIPNVIYTEPNRFSLIILPSFEGWYPAYILKKNLTVDNLSLLNLEKVYALVLDIDDKIQVSPSPTVTIGVRSINAWRFKLLQSNIIVEVTRRTREFRKDALDYLKSQDIINTYELKNYQDEVTLNLNIPKFEKLKTEVIKVYAEWKKGSEEQTKKIESIKLPSNTRWENIAIRFIDGHNIDIKAKGETFRSDYKLMGFEDKRSRSPDKQWELLIKLSENNGEIDWQSRPQSKGVNRRLAKQQFGFEEDGNEETQNRGFSYKKAPDSTKKTKQLLTKKLKAFFGIEEDPFFPYRKEGCYKIKITFISA